MGALRTMGFAGSRLRPFLSREGDGDPSVPLPQVGCDLGALSLPCRPFLFRLVERRQLPP